MRAHVNSMDSVSFVNVPEKVLSQRALGGGVVVRESMTGKMTLEYVRELEY